MDPLSITAAVVGITAPALHYVHLLLDDLQKIVDAPEAVRSLKDDLLSVNQALTSLQAVSDPQWESLGEPVVCQSKAATISCRESCDKFRTALGRWTRHSDDGHLSWQDRAMLGVFRQGHIKSMSEQLKDCKITLTSVVSIATLHSSLGQKQESKAIMTAISAKEAEIAAFITASDKQLVEVNAKLEALRLAKQDQRETGADRVDALSQVAVERNALGESRKLFEELLSGIRTAAADAQKDDARVFNSFGPQNEGMQIGVNHGGISGITFRKK